MELQYSAEPEHLDRPVYEAQAERPNKPIRLRIQPTILRQRAGEAVSNHISWSGVSWALECKTPEEAIGVREALRVFFLALRAHGSPTVIRALTAQP